MEDQTKRTVAISLVLMGALSPALLALFRAQQDCYSSRPDCEHEWGSSRCTDVPNPSNNQCRVVSSSYRLFRGGRTYGGYGRSTGTIVRGGFGSIGRAFSGFHGGG